MSPQQLQQSRILKKQFAVDGILPKQSMDITGAHVAVVGLDEGGISFAALAAVKGFPTVGFDTDEVKVAQLESYEAFEDARTLKNLSITSDAAHMRGADVFVLCTTPVSQRSELEELERAAAEVGAQLREGALVIVETVVFPGVCEQVVLPILEKASGLSRRDFSFAHSPAVLPESSVRVLGATDKDALERATTLYRALSSQYIIRPVRSLKEAESVRMVEDSFRDVGLALVGEFSILFDRIGVDVVNVMAAISPEALAAPALARGLASPSTSPSAFYLARSGHEHEFERQLVSNARRIIEYMPEYAVRTLAEALRDSGIELQDATVALLGLSEDDGSDFADGPGFKIGSSLERKGAKVQTYDPYVAGAGRDIKETLTGAQAVVIAAEHAMFKSLTPRQLESFGISIVVDAKNCLDKDLFEGSRVAYRGIGRG